MASVKEKEVLGLNPEAGDAEVLNRIASLVERETELKTILSDLRVSDAKLALNEIERLKKEQSPEAAQKLSNDELKECAERAYKNKLGDDFFINHYDGSPMLSEAEIKAAYGAGNYSRVVKGKIVD